MNLTLRYGRENELIRYHKRSCSLKTSGRWPWKSEADKECVTTHLTKRSALKMDPTEASSLGEDGFFMGPDNEIV